MPPNLTGGGPLFPIKNGPRKSQRLRGRLVPSGPLAVGHPLLTGHPPDTALGDGLSKPELIGTGYKSDYGSPFP